MTTGFDRSMDEIEVEIARTRARLAGEADLLAAELAPPRLVDKGADMLNGFLGRIGKIGRRGGGRADPAAFALIGLGIAWLVAENLGLLDEFMSRRGAELGTPGREDRCPARRRAGPALCGRRRRLVASGGECRARGAAFGV